MELKRKKRIAILALQGAFIEHEKILTELGAEVFEVRKKADLQKPFDALVLPGGESTVIGKLLKELDLFQPLKERLEAGMPVLATCAGLILLAAHISNDKNVYFGTMPITVRRNAYGRQLGSFEVEEEVTQIGRIPLRFIRAPYIEKVEDGVNILARVNGRIVGAQYGKQIGLAFHPELTADRRVHQYFLESI